MRTPPSPPTPPTHSLRVAIQHRMQSLHAALSAQHAAIINHDLNALTITIYHIDETVRSLSAYKKTCIAWSKDGIYRTEMSAIAQHITQSAHATIDSQRKNCMLLRDSITRHQKKIAQKSRIPISPKSFEPHTHRIFVDSRV